MSSSAFILDKVTFHATQKDADAILNTTLEEFDKEIKLAELLPHNAPTDEQTTRIHLPPNTHLDFLDDKPTVRIHIKPGTRLDFLEEKKPIPNTAECKQTKDDPKNGYLENFSKEEIDTLLKDFAELGVKNAADIEKLLSENPIIPLVFKIINIISISLNLGYVGFIATTGSGGIQTAAGIAGINVSSQAAKDTGIPMGIFDVTMYMLFFSATKESVKSALNYLLWRKKSVKERGKDFLTWARDNPLKFIGTLFLEIALLIFNSASMMTVLLGFVNTFSFPTLLALTPIVLLFGNVYMDKIAGKDTRDGVKFWFDKQGWQILNIFKSPTFSKLLENLSKFLQVLIQGLSTTVLTSYPLYFFLGYEILKDFKSSSTTAQNAAITLMVISLIRNLLLFYPVAYKRYLEPDKKLADSITELKTHSHAQVSLDAEKMKEKILQEEGYFKLLKKEKPGFIQCLFRLLVSIPLIIRAVKDPSASNISLVLGTLLFAFAGANANISRAQALGANEKIQEELTRLKGPAIKEEKNTPTWEKIVRYIAAFLSIDSAFGDLTTVMGSLLINDKSITLFLLILAFDRMLTTLEWYLKNSGDSLVSIARSKARFFSRSAEQCPEHIIEMPVEPSTSKRYSDDGICPQHVITIHPLPDENKNTRRETHAHTDSGIELQTAPKFA